MFTNLWLVCLATASSLFSQLKIAPEVSAPSDAPAPLKISAESKPMPETPTTTGPAASGASSARPVVHHPGDIIDPADQNQVTTAWEYIHTYEGLCPHEQPDGPFKSDHQYLAAVGQHAQYPTPEYHLEQRWRDWKNGWINRPTTTLGNAHNLGLSEYPYHLLVKVDWASLRVFTEPDTPALNAPLTVYLQDINQRYNTLCPND